MQHHWNDLPVLLHVWLHLPHHRLPLQSGRFQSLLPRPQLHHQYVTNHKTPTIGGSFKRVAKCILIRFLHLFFPSLPVPCCPENVTISLVSTETLEVMWSPVKGAELYETTAEQTNDVIHCNDTAPVCALSDLACNTAYSVTVTPCNDLRGCNRTCTSHTHETGKDMAQSQHRQKEGWKEQ